MAENRKAGLLLTGAIEKYTELKWVIDNITRTG
jgi:hypothetical protein